MSNRYTGFFKGLILSAIVLSAHVAQAQTNLALTAVATHSGGGATVYGPQNYNDNIIPAYNTLPWGWVSTAGWIEYTWTVPQTITKVKFYKDNRPFTSCTIQWWNGTAYVTAANYSSSVSPDDSISFPPVTTTKLRFNNCAGSSNPNFREITVFGVAAPNNAGVGALAEPPSAICAGSQDVKAQVINTGSLPLTNVKVNWSVDGILQPQISHNTTIATGGNAVILLGNINFPASVAKVIKVWTSQPNGVADTVNNDDTLTATRTALPAANATITANGPTRFCPGGTVTLQAPTGPSYTYQWKLNGNNITGGTSATYTATGSGIFTASVNNSVCASNSNPITVTVGPPQVNLGNDSAFCEGKTPFVLDANEPTAKYVWSTGDTTKTIALTDEGGTIWVNVILGASCIATDTVHLDISPLPKVSGMSYIKENGYTYFFEAAGARYVDKFLWIFSDNTTDTGVTVTHVFPVGQHHSARLVISNNCGKDSVELQLPLSVGNQNINTENIALYPNPASDKIMLDAGSQQIEEVMIINNLGAVVYRSQFGDKAAERQIDVHALANGQYYMRIKVEGVTLSKPFHIAR